MEHSLESLTSDAHRILEAAMTQGLINHHWKMGLSTQEALAEALEQASKEIQHLISSGKLTGNLSRRLQHLALANEMTRIGNDLFRLRLEQRNEIFALVSRALQRLRTAGSVSALLTRLPQEVVDLGYVRALYSNIDKFKWVAYSAFSANNPLEGLQLVEIGSQTPAQDMRPLMEYDMVKRREPVIFHDVQKSERVHPTLIRVTQSESMVAAPIISMSSVVGFVSIDARSDSGVVEEFDREVLNLLCVGVGALLDQLRITEQLGHVQNAPTISQLLSARYDETAKTPEPGHLVLPTDSNYRVDTPSVSVAVLTRREIEILELIAKGYSNRRIAEHLVVTLETVNSHVKSILRKLNVQNRTGAAAIFHKNRS